MDRAQRCVAARGSARGIARSRRQCASPGAGVARGSRGSDRVGTPAAAPRPRRSPRLGAGEPRAAVARPRRAGDPAPHRPERRGWPRPSRRLLGAAASAAGVLGEVVDAATGTVLYDRAAATTAAPASTAKLLTAAAVLAVHAPTDRITTRSSPVRSPARSCWSAAAIRRCPARRPDAAALRRRRAASATSPPDQRRPHRGQAIVVDDSLFTGPAVSPAWAPRTSPTELRRGDHGGDGRRRACHARRRPSAAPTPDLAAGHGARRRARAARTCRSARGTAPAGAACSRRVESAPCRAGHRRCCRTPTTSIAEVPGPAGRGRREGTGALHRRGARRSAPCCPARACRSAAG